MGDGPNVVCKPVGTMVCEERVINGGGLEIVKCSDAIYEMLVGRALEKSVEMAKIVFGWENKNYTDATINFKRFDEAESYTPGSNVIDLSMHESGTTGDTTVAWTLSGTYYCEKVENNSPKGSPLASR